jgi:hypothetical protein
VSPAQVSTLGLVELSGTDLTPAETSGKDFRILDMFANAAVAKIIASDWVDYIELAKWNGRWVIVNVLWEYKPRSE